MFMFDAEKVMEAVEPLAEAMMEIGSNSYKFTALDDNEDPLFTVVIARGDKAILLSDMADFIDKAFDAGIEAEERRDKTVVKDLGVSISNDDDDIDDWGLEDDEDDDEEWEP